MFKYEVKLNDDKTPEIVWADYVDASWQMVGHFPVHVVTLKVIDIIPVDRDLPENLRKPSMHHHRVASVFRNPLWVKETGFDAAKGVRREVTPEGTFIRLLTPEAEAS
jgi:hypothetical protein